MFCTECGKRPTTNKGKTGNRTINPVTKICNECENINNGNTTTGLGGAKKRDSISDGGDMVTEEIDLT